MRKSEFTVRGMCIQIHTYPHTILYSFILNTIIYENILNKISYYIIRYLYNTIWKKKRKMMLCENAEEYTSILSA